MVNITKFQRLFYSIQLTLIVTNTFLVACICYSHCTGVYEPEPVVCSCVRACVCVQDCVRMSAMLKTNEEKRLKSRILPTQLCT